MKLGLAMLGLAILSAEAGLKWDTTEQTLHVHPVQASAVAVFGFTNSGSDVVTISKVNISCGCLAPQIARRTYAPGESGELSVRFDLRNRTGHQEKRVVVETSDGLMTKLKIEGEIPEAYSIGSKMIVWKKNDAAQAKTVRLVNPNKEPITLKSISASNNLLPAELKPIRAGFEYEVVITRKPGAVNARSVIRIEPEPPRDVDECKILKLYVHAQ